MQQVPPNPLSNTGVAAKDGTTAANAGGCCTTGTDLTEGFHKLNVEAIPIFSDEVAGGENEVGNPLNRGGFLGRPNGWQR